MWEGKRLWHLSEMPFDVVGLIQLAAQVLNERVNGDVALLMRGKVLDRHDAVFKLLLAQNKRETSAGTIRALHSALKTAVSEGHVSGDAGCCAGR